MQYANITFETGAAINAHKVLWNYPERFKNIIIHLGDFHFMKEIFAVLGKLVCGSGFEDVVFQTGICSSESLNGVLSGSHYNRCWTVHSIFAEALKRLLFKRFAKCDNMPDRVRILLENESVDEFEIKRLLEDDEVRNMMIRCNRFKERIRHGDYGKTAQFWLLYYLDIMFNQHLTHYAVQTNNFMLRLHRLKTALPFFFALNLQTMPGMDLSTLIHWRT